MGLKQAFRDLKRNIALALLAAVAMAAVCVAVGQRQAARSAVDDLQGLYTTLALPSPIAHTVKQTAGDTIFQYTSSLLTQEQQDLIDILLEENADLVKTVSYTGLASAYIPQLQPELYVQYDYQYSVYQSGGLQGNAPYGCVMLEIQLEAVSDRVKDIIDIKENGLVSLEKTAQWYEELNSYYCVVLTAKVTSVVGLQPDYPDPTGYTARLVLMLPGEAALQELNLQAGERYLVYGMDYCDLDWKNSLQSKKNQTSVHSISFTLKDYFALEDYSQEYALPTIARLEGTVEEFLLSDEGQLWQKALEGIAINSQCFPILGVDDLSYIADFARQDARIVQGRDFTAEELETGAKVCILSQSLATANGIEVGDTITLRYYDYDFESPYQSFLMEDDMAAGIQAPSAVCYSATTPFVNEGESYTVVGLYRNNEWEYPADNVYSFTPNTIFVPKASVSGSMDFAGQGLFRAIVLENGGISAFRSATEAVGQGDLFTYYDQGYAEVQKSIQSLRGTSRTVLICGLIFAGGSLLLYLLIGAQLRKPLNILTALGASPGRKTIFVLTQHLVVLLPGTAAGLGLSLLLWEKITGLLTAAPLEIAPATLALTAGAALLLTLLLGLLTELKQILGRTAMKQK